jgi:N-methylhydantoinase B
MRLGDVYAVVSQGGGGYGDPLDRDPQLVAQDVERMLVTPEWAQRAWGVVLGPDGAADAAATEAERARLRLERRRAAGLGEDGRAGAAWDADRDGVRLLESLFYDTSGDAPVYRCRCGTELGPADTPYKELAAQARFPVQRIGPQVNPARVGGARFELREFYCPGCTTLLEVEIARPDDPVLDDARLSGEWVAAAALRTEAG